MKINLIDNKEIEKYCGYFKNNLKEGEGEIYLKNKEKIESEWKEDKIGKKIIYYYNNGDKYEGEWENYKKNGKGILYYKNGDKYNGEFKNDLKKEKEKCIIIMEIYMKVNIKKI